MKRIYVKRDTKFWTFKRVNKHSMKIWKTIIVLMALIVLWAVINKWVNRNPLVDPRCPSSFNPVSQVMAKEPEVFISCEDPKGYLQCQAYQGKITWAEHDRIYKVIECESKWNPEAINTKNKNGTIDTGLVQRNSIHGKSLSTKDSFDYKKSIDWMIKKMHRDGSLNAWVCNRLVK